MYLLCSRGPEPQGTPSESHTKWAGRFQSRTQTGALRVCALVLEGVDEGWSRTRGDQDPRDTHLTSASLAEGPTSVHLRSGSCPWGYLAPQRFRRRALVPAAYRRGAGQAILGTGLAPGT